jgi:hypothetical protein
MLEKQAWTGISVAGFSNREDSKLGFKPDISWSNKNTDNLIKP